MVIAILEKNDNLYIEYNFKNFSKSFIRDKIFLKEKDTEYLLSCFRNTEIENKTDYLSAYLLNIAFYDFLDKIHSNDFLSVYHERYNKKINFHITFFENEKVANKYLKGKFYKKIQLV